jgi:hypothetical protein
MPTRRQRWRVGRRRWRPGGWGAKPEADEMERAKGGYLYIAPSSPTWKRKISVIGAIEIPSGAEKFQWASPFWHKLLPACRAGEMKEGHDVLAGNLRGIEGGLQSGRVNKREIYGICWDTIGRLEYQIRMERITTFLFFSTITSFPKGK